MQPPVERIMLAVVQQCERLALPYFVTGSVASMAWGEPRFTQDVDMVIELPSWKVKEFCAAFPAPEWYVSEEAAMHAAQAPDSFNILLGSAPAKADIIVFEDTPFNSSRLARARPMDFEGRAKVMVSAPEDVILKKLEFYKMGGSDKHLRDIASMIKISGALIDYAYLEHWALRLNVQSHWAVIKRAAI